MRPERNKLPFRKGLAEQGGVLAQRTGLTLISATFEPTSILHHASEQLSPDTRLRERDSYSMLQLIHRLSDVC